MRRQVIELTRQFDVPDPVWQGQYIVEIIEVSAAYLAKAEPDQASHYHNLAHQLITDIEMRAAQATSPFPGMRQLLDRLRGHGIKLGVVTRNCRPAVLATFPDLLDYVDQLTARGDCEFLKPDPRHATHCLQMLETPPAQASMVGDGKLDMHLGRELGMFCVGVTSGSQDADGLRSHGAHQVLEQLRHDTVLEQLLSLRL